MLRKTALGLCVAFGVCSMLLPLAAQAQKTEKSVRLGIICGVRCEGRSYDVLNAELTRLGWVEGRNVTVDRRGGGGEQDRLPALAAELVAMRPDLMVAVGPQAAHAAKNAAGTIPIVIVAVADPIGAGLVQTLARPGGTITGFTTLVPGGFGGKQLGLLMQALPGATRIAALVNPKNDMHIKLFPSDVPPATTRIGVQLQVVEASSPNDLEGAIDAAVRERAAGLVVYGDPMFHTPPGRLPDLAARAGLPAIYLVGDVTQAGGLMSYGPDYEDMFRRAAGYVDRILKGATPADLPIEQPTKFLLIINLKTATALGLTIPPSLLILADEVIQ